MNTRIQTLSKLLPALALPIALTAATEAHAGLVVDGYDRTPNVAIEGGFGFDITLYGTATHKGTDYPAEVDLGCEVYPAQETFECWGTLDLAGQVAVVTLAFDDQFGPGPGVRWGIDADASKALRMCHWWWTGELIPNLDPNSIDLLEIWDVRDLYADWATETWEGVSPGLHDPNDGDGPIF